MVTHTRNLCSAFDPFKVHTHSSEHTHTVNTHPEQWAAICCGAWGAVGGSVVSASDVTPTERWLNGWYIWHTFLETLQECRSRHLTGWIKPDFWETRGSRLFSARRETNMPWRQSPSRKKKAVMFTNVTTNVHQGQLNAGFSKVCEIFTGVQTRQEWKRWQTKLHPSPPILYIYIYTLGWELQGTSRYDIITIQRFCDNRYIARQSYNDTSRYLSNYENKMPVKRLSASFLYSSPNC